MALTKTTLSLAVATIGLALAAGAAIAADPAADTPGGKAVLGRQAHYRELNAAFRTVNDDLRKDMPDKAAIAADVGKMKALTDDLPSWFPKGSGPEAGVKTRAKAEIWTDAAGFAAAATRIQAETGKLQDAATAGEIEALKAQAKAVNGACKACHDAYRG
jgi:cytochrome c556